MVMVNVRAENPETSFSSTLLKRSVPLDRIEIPFGKRKREKVQQVTQRILSLTMAQRNEEKLTLSYRFSVTK